MVLHALAAAGGSLTRTALVKALQRLQVRGPNNHRLINSADLNAVMTKLEQRGILVLDSGNGVPVRLTEGQLIPLLSSLRSSPILSLLCEAVFTALPTHNLQWQRPSPAQALQLAWLAILSGNLELLRESLEVLERDPALQDSVVLPLDLLLSDEGRGLWQRLAAPIRHHLLRARLAIAEYRHVPVEPAYLAARELALAEGGQFAETLSRDLFWQALWRGDRTAFEALAPERPLEIALVAPLLNGDPQRALSRFDEAQKVWRRSSGNKGKLKLSPLLQAWYCLALIGAGRPEDIAKLNRAIDRNLRDWDAYTAHLLAGMAEMLRSSLPNQDLQALVTPLRKAGHRGDFAVVVSMLCLHWLAPEQRDSSPRRRVLRETRDGLQATGQTWLAAQLDAILEPSSPSTEGWAPLVALHQARQSWEYALEALTRLRPATATASASATLRLAWFIELAHGEATIEAREQKFDARSQQWSKGRVVALSRLRGEQTPDYLSAQDREVAALIELGIDSRYGYYGSPRHQLPPERALPRLAGHPALFLADAPNVRIDIETGQASVHVHDKNKRLRLELRPAQLSISGELLIERETPTLLRVYPIDAGLRQVAEILGAGLEVPVAAKPQVIAALGAIAPLLPVHTELPELAPQLARVAGETTVFAHLLPLQEGLRLQLLVRPHPASHWLRPGQGSERLLGEQDGLPVQIERDLERERDNLRYALDNCPMLAQAEQDGNQWQLQQVQDALQLLSELQALDPQRVQCLWPEGERLRIRARTGMQQLRLNMQAQGAWFDVRGELSLDDGRVLQLQQLLELMRAGSDRFVRLGDNDWLALNQDLRRRLDELAHLSEPGGKDGAARVSALALPLLAELADEAGQVEADTQWRQQRERLQSLRHYQPALPATLQTELRDYQREGFQWLARMAQWGVGACLADDMGLGKTVQTLALLLHRAGSGPQLVVAPTSVVANWEDECRRFAPNLVVRNYHRQRQLDDLGAGQLVLVSYGLLQHEREAFAAIAWTSAVLDEAQAIKNTQPKRSQSVMALQAEFRLVVTGTPLENHLGELWNLLRFANPGLLGSLESFNRRFALPIEQGDASARRALKALIQPFMLRRRKSQVLDELPMRTEITHKVPLSEEEAHQYEALRRQALVNLGDGEDGGALQVLAEITRLRRFCCHPSLVLPGSKLAGSKLEAFTEIVDELIGNGHRALVFSQFVDHLTIVREWLDRQHIAYQYLDGATPAAQRKTRVDAFQGGDGAVFLISLKAGGSGLNLTAADYVIHLDPWWNPAVEDQASDRAHRIGQQRPVTIYRLVAENTIEEQIVELHARKRDLADSLLEGSEASARLDADALLRLLRDGHA